MSEIRDAALHFEAVKIALTQDKNGLVLKLSLHPDDTPKDMILSPLGTRYMVAMVQLSDEDKPVKGREKTEGERAVAIAGTLCRNSRFIQWMVDKGYADKDTPESVAEGLRSICGVNSRAELATNEEARANFMELRELFESEFKRGFVK